MDSPVPLNYNNITVSIMLLMIILNLKIGHKHLSRTSRYMLMMCLSIIVILLSDTAFWEWICPSEGGGAPIACG
ncbi:MAG: hypothetical protein JXA95_11820 [Spirochaetales bacterium]|nr:hypothetical protein [Spirochaetales bacterium]